MDRNVKVSLIALGCSKNLVDAECMVKLLKQDGYEIVEDYTKSQVVVINTCGFIESAKTEAIDTILQVSDYKAPQGSIQFIVVTGCLSQRYSQEISDSLPEVDAILGTSHYQDICQVLHSLFEKKDSNPITLVSKAGGMAHLLPSREVSTKGYAWLKIGEGCRHRCTFCAIPLIRGTFVSRPLEEILQEARDLAFRGYKEIILAAQDTTNYGIELYKKRSLPLLLRELSKIQGIELIRVMYGYMDGIEDDLIQEIKTNPKVAHYLDIPIQHADDEILSLMHRRETSDLISSRLEAIRREIPDIIIRTTVMVGFPGETQEAFDNLMKRLKEWKFDRLGCFMFSPEEGTPAYDMPNQVDDSVKQLRYEAVYTLQKQISLEANQNRLNSTVEVTIESISDDGIFYKGRSFGEAPEVDPEIYVVATEEELTIGNKYNVKIVDISDYELTGVTI